MNPMTAPTSIATPPSISQPLDTGRVSLAWLTVSVATLLELGSSSVGCMRLNYFPESPQAARIFGLSCVGSSLAEGSCLRHSAHAAAAEPVASNATYASSS